MKAGIFLWINLLFSTIVFSQYYVPSTAGTGAISSVFVGNTAGQDNVGNTNVFVGNNAGQKTTTVEESSYFGHSAGRYATGSQDVFIGLGAGAFAGGGRNVCVGHEAGNGRDGADTLRLGDRNVLIGYRTGHNLQGNDNVFIGYNVGSNITGNNLLYIDNSPSNNPLICGNFSSNQLKFNAKKVGIGFEGTTGDEGFGGFPALTGLTNADKYRLFVRGGILAEEVRIRLHEDWIWPDYVFTKDYNLLSLKDTEKFIAENGHLPNMPSAEKVKAEGVELGNIVTLQQEKIEELTLHLIDQQKQIDELQEQNEEIEILKAQIKLLMEKQ